MWFNLKELKDIINSKRVLKIALPMMLSNITVPLLGFVDTAVIGQLGDAKLIAALGLGSILISTLYWLCGFLRMGITGLTAQALGSKQTDEVFLTLLRGLLLGVFLGFFIPNLEKPEQNHKFWIGTLNKQRFCLVNRWCSYVNHWFCLVNH